MDGREHHERRRRTRQLRLREHITATTPHGQQTPSETRAQRGSGGSAVELRGAELAFGSRVLWHDLDLDVEPGEFIAVLGPNGTGKTSLLKVLLGQYRLSRGSAKIAGHPVRVGDHAIGYVPQQRGIDPHTPMRGRDLVGYGVDGHRWGPGFGGRKRRRAVDELIEAVAAESYADAPAGTLSGGELQRLRVAQALASDPAVLLCDEPLLSLDLHHQERVAALIDAKRRERDTAVLFVTHEINPIMPYVDRVLYLAGGHFLIGPPSEVMTTEALSALFGTRVEVVEVGGRLVIAGGGHNHHHPFEREVV